MYSETVDEVEMYGCIVIYSGQWKLCSMCRVYSMDRKVTVSQAFEIR